MKELDLAARIRRKRKYSSYKGEIGKKADNFIQRQLKLQSPTKNVIPISQNLPFQSVHKSYIYHLF